MIWLAFFPGFPEVSSSLVFSTRMGNFMYVSKIDFVVVLFWILNYPWTNFRVVFYFCSVSFLFVQSALLGRFEWIVTELMKRLITINNGQHLPTLITSFKDDYNFFSCYVFKSISSLFFLNHKTMRKKIFLRPITNNEFFFFLICFGKLKYKFWIRKENGKIQQLLNKVINKTKPFKARCCTALCRLLLQMCDLECAEY